MQVVVRSYTGKGASELFAILEKQQSEVEDLMRSVEGLVSYTLARGSDGGFSVTVCQDKRGIDQSVEKAREFVAKNAANAGAAPPQISEGTVIAHV